VSPQRRDIRSAYIEWAKLRSDAAYSLAPSGVVNFPLRELGIRGDDLEITGPVGYGYAPLQERLAKRAGVAPENVVHAQGTSMANHLALAALLETDDEVLIEEPGYEALIATAHYLGAKVRRFTRKFEAGFQVDPREVERAITPRTRIIAITNLHNPSGARTPQSTLRMVGEIAKSLGAHVLVDEVYLECCFDSPWTSAFHLGSNFVATSSLTKAYGLSGLRCGWVLAAPALAQRMWRLHDLFGVNAAHPAEILSVMALDRLEEIGERAKKILDTNRAKVKAFLDSRRDLVTIWPEVGTVVFPQLTTGHADAFCQLLREKYETSVVPGRFFDAPEHFRIGMGVDPQRMDEPLKRLAAALDEFAKRQ
jgi:aspartate/methionine/tyrosine aminotransferase